MSIETIGAFYEGTELGQFLIGQGRQEGRQEGRANLLASLLHARFGDRPEIELLARRLALRSDDEALESIQSAESMDELLP